jgi:ribosomal protein S10
LTTAYRVTVPEHVTVEQLRELDVPEGVKVQIKEE